MIKQSCHFVLSIALLLAGCSASTFISEMEKTQATADYNACNTIISSWLAALDESNYAELLALESYNKKLSKKKITEIVTNYQNSFGRVKEREFIGAHFWAGKKLISWVPNVDEKMLAHTHQQKSPDDFYRVAPRYFGLLYEGQMFAGFPEGRYVILMYKCVPTNKNYAEEAITLRKPKNGNWQVHGYHIADEV